MFTSDNKKICISRYCYKGVFFLSFLTLFLGCVNAQSMALHCDTGLEWSKFVKAAADAVMSPNEDVLLK